MNASITGVEGDSCPKCGMKLMPMSAEKTEHAHH